MSWLCLKAGGLAALGTAVVLLSWLGVSLALEQLPEVDCNVGAAIACKGKIPDISGTYTGAVQDAISGSGTISLGIEQRKKRITGIWDTSYPNGTGASGSLTGTVSKTSIKAKLTTRYRNCFYHVLVSIHPDSFRGTFVDTRRCPAEDSGSFIIKRGQ